MSKPLSGTDEVDLVGERGDPAGTPGAERGGGNPDMMMSWAEDDTKKKPKEK
jgi:hypothetical protein